MSAARGYETTRVYFNKVPRYIRKLGGIHKSPYTGRYYKTIKK